MSKYTSVDNFVKSFKGQFSNEWRGLDGEYFLDNKFYVDDTCLCKVTSDAMYISQNALTPKCSLYLHELTVRSNELNANVIYVPQWYKCDKRTHDFSNSGIIEAFRVAVFELKDKRDIYSKAHLEEIRATLLKLNFIPHKLKAEVEEILSKMNEATRVEDKAVKKIISENSYYDIVQAAYFNFGDYDVRTRMLLKQYLNPSGEYAFLSYNRDDGYIYSSECMCGLPKKTMTLEEGLAIGTAYLGGTAKHGQKYGRFTIMRVMENYIQVSCNRYCKEMFQAMYPVLIENRKEYHEKFDNVAEMQMQFE